MTGPSLVRFSRHALQRLPRAGLSTQEVSDVLLEGHHSRRRNPRDADWLLRVGRHEIAYNWPDRGDATTALW